MKKITMLLLAFVLVFSCVGCGSDGGKESEGVSTDENSGEESGSDSAAGDEDSDKESEPDSAADDENSEGESGNAADGQESEGVMTYEEYAAAELETRVVVETYVQAKQAWWEDKATIYTQDEDGAYFLYEMPCSREDYEKLVPGTKIKVTGYKGEWSGEVEIIDIEEFEIEDGSYIAEAEDVTSLLGSDDLINHQNRFVAFKGMTVEAIKDADGNDVAFLYNWDGSGQDGNDLYFNVSVGGETYTFTVESYLCDNTTDVYAAVKALNIGDKIDMEGFLYWYNGVNPHITSVTAAD